MLTKSFGVDGVMGGFYFVLCSVLTFKKYLLHLIWYNSIQYALVSYQKVQRQLTKVSVKYKIAAAAAKLLQSCPTLYDSIDGSPPGSPVPGILQARALEWGCHFLLLVFLIITYGYRKFTYVIRIIFLLARTGPALYHVNMTILYI